jgi:toxin ParE1/3/4
VLFSPEAKSDLEELYEYTALHSGEDRALAFVERIEHWTDGLASFPERGTKRDDIRPGLRVAEPWETPVDHFLSFGPGRR